MRNKLRSSPVNILVISPYFLPTIGGSQRYIEELYAHVIALYPHIHVDILAYNTEHALERETHRGLTIYRIPCKELIPGQFALPNMFALWGMLLFFAQKHIAFVHTHIRFFDATWWTWLYARLIGAKSIFTEQVAAHPVHDNKVVTTVAKLVDLTLAKWSISHYDMITTTNSAAKTFLKETLHIKKPITVSYGGVDTAYFSPKPAKTIPHVARKVPKKAIVVTFASRLLWSKGITYFLDALRTMKTLPKNVHVVIAGEGPLRETVEQTVLALPNKKQIHVVGGLNYKEMKQLLQATDIFVHPSHHNEGFPNVILEALASHCFVIATNNAGTGEMIVRGKTGLLIRQKSTQAIVHSLESALSHMATVRSTASLGRMDVVKRFDWKFIASSFYSLIQRFCTFTVSYQPSASLFH